MARFLLSSFNLFQVFLSSLSFKLIQFFIITKKGKSFFHFFSNQLPLAFVHIASSLPLNQTHIQTRLLLLRLLRVRSPAFTFLVCWKSICRPPFNFYKELNQQKNGINFIACPEAPIQIYEFFLCCCLCTFKFESGLVLLLPWS